MSRPRTHDVVVLGSANLDVVLAVETIPVPGETTVATAEHRHAGGKGLNQSVAAARTGARTALLAALGRDEAATTLREVAHRAGVDMAQVRVEPGRSGRAFITVQPDGENTIVVSSGANAAMQALTERERALIGDASVLVAQLELPLSGVREGLAAARGAQVTTVLNAAPARAVDRSLLELVDVLVVNEHEARTLAASEADPVTAAHQLRSQVQAVVVTLGADGCVVADASGCQHLPAVPARPVDTTGAGDTFTGVLAASLATGATLPSAAARAAVAAAISVEGPGAVPSIPTREQIEERAASARTDP